MTCERATSPLCVGTRLDKEQCVAAATSSENHWRQTMKTNEGNLDRALRIVAGLVLIGLAATGKVGLWGYIGVVPLLTAPSASARCTPCSA